jgi:hypothetical protein
MSNEGEFFRGLLEVFKTKKDLTWANQSGLYTTSFILDSQQYGITIREDSADDITFYEVSFTADNTEGRSHAATNFNKNQFKILGIVSNGIKEKIKDADLVYFTAKSYTSNSDIEYQSKVKLYSRLAHKMAVELNMYEEIKSLGDETVFILARSQPLLARAPKEFNKLEI